MQRLLVDQLREGPRSRLDSHRARAWRCARRVPQLSLAHGAPLAARPRVLEHRQRRADHSGARSRIPVPASLSVERGGRPRNTFPRTGLKSAIDDTIEEPGLAGRSHSQVAGAARSDRRDAARSSTNWRAPRAPRTRDGVWVSADGERTLLVARTAAAGSDTDAQERALDAIRSAFTAAAREVASPAARSVQLNMSGPGVFAVAARAKIKSAVVRLSIAQQLADDPGLARGVSVAARAGSGTSAGGDAAP